jgi:hypothetical protein
LPKNRVFFALEHQRLLKFYANSTVAEIDDPSFYSDERVFDQHFDTYHPENSDYVSTIRKRLERISDSLSDLSNRPASDSITFLSGIKTGISDLDAIQKLIREAENAKKGSSTRFYIYYAAPSEKNPYNNRPYMQPTDQDTETFIFNRHPERFRMVYSDMENEIYIWEIL